MKAILAMIAAASLASSAARPAQSRPSGKSRARQVFVSVSDAGGAPVLDLSPADFEVKEAGVQRPATRATLGADAMRIVMVADTSDGAAAALTHIRAGLLTFLDALPPEHEVMIVSTGRQTRVRVPPTIDRKKLKDAAAGLFSDGGATVLTDTVLEMDDRFLRKADHRWPVFVIVTGDGTEGSTGAHEKQFDQWIAAMPARGITAHAVVLKYKGGGTPEIIASHLAQTCGGIYEFINTSNSLTERMKVVADRIVADTKAMATWYTVEFQSDGPENGPLEVGVARSGIKLRISHRRGAQ